MGKPSGTPPPWRSKAILVGIGVLICLMIVAWVAFSPPGGGS
ncbi:hypothetical protein [Leekyejoonella antrihumi]|nr:hypothetical protein [Leekyejoonella antrihumi]